MSVIRDFFTKASIILICLIAQNSYSQDTMSDQAVNADDVISTMKLATTFMVEKVSYKGGYVWSYLPDFSRRWGEMEAYPTMVWVQPPGTPTIGHLFLDAYHATHDEYYYDAAYKAAKALIMGQHPSGGWNYLIDLAGEESLKKWYETIGANGWRLEEFQHYYGNATFDDEGTAESAKLLLRIYLEKHDEEIKTALDKVIGFIKESQYANGGWPQRYPPAGEFSKQGHADYTSYITFNDEVAQENIDFFIMCYQTLGDTSLLKYVYNAMETFLVTQQPKPQAGWALQYTKDLKPAGARTYEPAALSTGTTVSNIFQLMDYYQLTGDKKYLEPIPNAIEWLESVRLPDEMIEEDRAYPLFVEIGTNEPLFLHRKGSNVTNGKYYADHDPEHTIMHYRSTRYLDIDAIKERFNAVKEMPYEKAIEDSPLKSEVHKELPPYYIVKDFKISDLNSRHLPRNRASEENVKKIISDLNEQGYWPTPLRTTTNPYIGPGPKKVTKGDFGSKFVGDKYDTSPYFTDKPQEGISTMGYIRNMSILIEYLKKQHDKTN